MASRGNVEPVLTVAEAAMWFRVQPSTVRMWMRGVEHVGMRDNAKLYRFRDLAEAERRARNAPTQPGRKAR